MLSVYTSDMSIMWEITKYGLSSPVTYGVVPEGATENTKAKPLEKGTEYTFFVSTTTLSECTMGFVNVIYE